MNRIVDLSEKDVFNIFIGKRVLKRTVFNSEGEIPVYSANVKTPFGFLEKSNIKNFSHDSILWGIDGEFGLSIKHRGEKFATTDHCGVIEILDQNILPEYLIYQLELAKSETGFDRSLRSSIENMEKVSISIPITEDGNFDTALQIKIAEKFTKLNLLKQRMAEIRQDFNKIQVGISEKEIGKFTDVVLGNEKFFLVNNGERITKKNIEDAKGDIPVYSASIFEDEVLGYVSDLIQEIVPDARFFEGINLTINADGSDYAVFVRENKFYANDVCNVVTIIDPNIDPYYLKHELLTQILRMELDYSYKLYKKKLKQIRVRIPINEGEKFDLQKQKEIAAKFEKIYHAKNEFTQQLSELIKAAVSVSPG